MPKEKKPSRGLAIFLTFFGSGVGHYYVGLKRRAAFWFLATSSLALLTAAIFPILGRALGFTAAFLILILAFLSALVGPIVDLVRLDPKRFSYVPTFHVFLFWIAIGIVGSVSRFAIRQFFVEAFKIPSGGMTPTLLPGDHLFADKSAFLRRDPDRGEPMVFAFPERPDQDFIQRVIAVSGDELTVKSGHPFINGWEVPHCKIGEGQFPGAADSQSEHGEVDVEFLDGHAYLTFYDESAMLAFDQGPFFAKDGEFWTLGDNRFNSHDSRMWRDGLGAGVPRELVKGLALFIWLHADDQGVDGSRTGISLAEPHLPKLLESLRADLDRCMQARPPYEKTVPPKR